MENQNRLLFVQSYRTEIPFIYMYTGLDHFREILINGNPEMEKWAPKELFQIKPIWPDRLMSNTYSSGANVAGSFIAKNIDTPTTVMKGVCTPERIVKELKKAEKKDHPYTHVGFSVFIDSYITFINNAQAVKQFDKNIITVAGNVGSLFECTKNYVDYVCIGDGVSFFRKLFGEEVNKPYQLLLIPSKIISNVFGITLKSEIVNLTTKLGCPHNCDFCGTYQLFRGKCTNAFFNPKKVHDVLVQYREKIKKDFTILIAEPTAITSYKWWYELFDLFQGEKGDYPIYALTTPLSLINFNFDRITKSSLRFQVFNLGIESFSRSYSKSSSFEDVKKLVKKLSDYGIATYATYIIGFDHHTHKKVWEDMYKLVNLDAAIYSILNLKPIPNTPIWNELKKEGRLLDVPYDLYYLQGFQPFLHPYFKPGFEDMLPFLCEIHAFFEKETGSLISRYIELYDTLNKLDPQKKFEKDLKRYKYLSKALFSSWKNYLDPTNEQIERYISLIEDIQKVPLFIKLLKNSSLFRKFIRMITN